MSEWERLYLDVTSIPVTLFHTRLFVSISLEKDSNLGDGGGREAGYRYDVGTTV